MSRMGYGSIIACVGVILVALGLVFGYLSGVHMEHTVTSVNLLSVIATYLEDIGVTVVLVVAGGLMVVLGIKKS